VFTSMWQMDTPDAFLAVRAGRNGAALAQEIRETILRMDPSVTVSGFSTMGELVAGAGAGRRFQTLLLTTFAAVALCLTLVGVYGLITYSMKQRTREIGIRMALGATRWELLSMVLREGMVLSG